jgi:repressor LexA
VREIGDAFDIKSSSVFHLLKELERKGYLERGELGARSLIVKGRKRVPCGCEEVPIVGRIPAGRPVEAIEDETGRLHVNKELLRGRGGFALQVVGDSMVDAGILDGDYVIISKQETAEDGDVIVALIEDEATLKRFHREGNSVRLDPANRTMQPIHVRRGEFRIQGKVVGIQRHIGRFPQQI